MSSFITSLQKNKKGIILAAIASLMTSVGQLLWKISNGQDIIALLSGFICYGFGAICLVIAFRYGSLSVIHPMLSLGYIFALVLGYIVLKESISLKHFTAICIIITGVIFIGGGDD